MFKQYPRILAFTLLANLFILAGCATTEPSSGVSSHSVSPTNGRFVKEFPKVAVLVHSKRPRYELNDSMIRVIEDNIMKVMLQKKYRVPSRSDLKKVIAEIDFQNSGLTNSGGARIGKMLNAPAVFIVHLAEIESRRTPGSTTRSSQTHATVSGRLINTETAEVMWIDSKTGSARKKYSTPSQLVGSLASQLAAGM